MNPERFYRQEITYWAATGGDDGNGQANLAAPVTFLGRWAAKTDTVLSSRGEQIVSKAIVHFPKDANVLPDGYLALGRYAQNAGNPAQIPGAYIVRNVNIYPDLRELKSAYVAVL